jgi:hypothetical protein
VNSFAAAAGWLGAGFWTLAALPGSDIDLSLLFIHSGSAHRAPLWDRVHLEQNDLK